MRSPSIGPLAIACACASALAASACELVYPLSDRFTRGEPSAEGGSPGHDDASSGAPDGGRPHPYRDAVVADAPLLYLRLGETHGPDALDQMHPGASGGTYGGGPFFHVPGALAEDDDGAIELRGADLITITRGDRPELSGAAPFSVELWIKPNAAFGADYTALVGHEQTSGTRHGWSLLAHQFEVPDVMFEMFDAAGQYQGVRGGATIQGGVFTYLVSVFDGSSCYLYVGGERLLAAERCHPISYTGPLIVGRSSDVVGNFFVGVVDELALYDHALSAERVAAHYRAAR